MVLKNMRKVFLFYIFSLYTICQFVAHTTNNESDYSWLEWEFQSKTNFSWMPPDKIANLSSRLKSNSNDLREAQPFFHILFYRERLEMLKEISPCQYKEKEKELLKFLCAIALIKIHVERTYKEVEKMYNHLVKTLGEEAIKAELKTFYEEVGNKSRGNGENKANVNANNPLETDFPFYNPDDKNHDNENSKTHTDAKKTLETGSYFYNYNPHGKSNGIDENKGDTHASKSPRKGLSLYSQKILPEKKPVKHEEPAGRKLDSWPLRGIKLDNWQMIEFSHTMVKTQDLLDEEYNSEAVSKIIKKFSQNPFSVEELLEGVDEKSFFTKTDAENVNTLIRYFPHDITIQWKLLDPATGTMFPFVKQCVLPKIQM